MHADIYSYTCSYDLYCLATFVSRWGSASDGICKYVG